MADSDIESRDFETRDSAFLWETEALRSSTTRPAPLAAHKQRKPDADWLTLRQASETTGIPISTLRKWARRESIPTYLEETPTGQLRMVSLSGVRTRANDLGRERPAHSERAVAPAAFVPPPTEPETPPGTMLVPIDAWDKMLLQLGNLHEAGQQLAEARERAARAETEAKFLKERLAELRTDLAEARTVPSPQTHRPRVEEQPVEPISHIPIESEDDEPDDDLEIPVRDLGRTDPNQQEAPSAGPGEDGEMTISAYSLEMMKHIYSTWRGRPRR